MVTEARFSPTSHQRPPLSNTGREVEVRAYSQRTEGRTILDVGSERSWLELVRDVVAVGNSGGGVLFVEIHADDAAAVRDNGIVAEFRPGPLRQRLQHYTGEPFDRLQARPLDQAGGAAVAITVPAANVPVGFTMSGVCADPIDEGRNHVVFDAGTFNFRHGESSEPGTTDDMRAFVAARLRRLRREWLRGICRVLVTTADSMDDLTVEPVAMPRQGAQTAPPQPVRIVTDPAAPALQPQDVERLFPWRQKELVRELSRRLGQRRLTSYDLQAVRRHHRLDARPDFVFHLPGAGRRYSDAAADWIVEQRRQNPAFFQQARAADQEMLKLRRQKPR